MKPDNSDIPLNEQRRDFITTSGQLVIGFCILQLPFSTQNEKTGRSAAVARSAIARSAGDPKAIDSWIRVDTNGNVTVQTFVMALDSYGVRFDLENHTAVSSCACCHRKIPQEKKKTAFPGCGLQ